MFYDWSTFWRAMIAGILTYATIYYMFSKLISSKDKQPYRKRVNISTSFIHSILSSIISLYLFAENPAMCTTNIISSFTPKAYLFISFELGYFIFDSFEKFCYPLDRQAYEILLHHTTIIGCFGIALYLGRYIGYAVISLYIEINSIFLHLRQLLLLWNMPKHKTIYRMNNILNLCTLLVFRFGIVIYMSLWLIMNHSGVPLILCIIGHTGLLIMLIINSHLFYRLIKSDFLVKQD